MNSITQPGKDEGDIQALPLCITANVTHIVYLLYIIPHHLHIGSHLAYFLLMFSMVHKDFQHNRYKHLGAVHLESRHLCKRNKAPVWMHLTFTNPSILINPKISKADFLKRHLISVFPSLICSGIDVQCILRK